MTDLSTIARQNGVAVAQFVADAREVPEDAWLKPVAPGKWSPAQVTEHVCLAYEVSQKGVRSGFPGATAPRFLRPVIRKFYLGPVLRNGRFGAAARAPGIFTPALAPAPAAVLLPRLERASQELATDLETEFRAGRGDIEHPFFGRIPITDFLRLQAIHTEHHRHQLSRPVAPA